MPICTSCNLGKTVLNAFMEQEPISTFSFPPFNFPSIEGVGVGKGQGEREEIKATIERKNGEVIIRRISNYWTSL